LEENKLYSQKQLFEQLSEGSEKAFRAIFELYKNRFYAVALKMTRSEYIAEEIVQEVFVTIWDRRTRLVDVEKPDTYLFTTVYNSIYAHFKKIALEKRTREALFSQPEELESPLELLLQHKENEQLLQRAIAHLPPQQQLVYKLLKQDGLSREEVAAQLHISPNTVKNHLQEAMKFLRTYLERALPLLIFLFFKKS
jgi:RNA polymerase sigma-70 factor (ECF subfamily)